MGRQEGRPPDSAAPVQWTVEIPLLTNRYLVGGLARAILGGTTLVASLVAFLLAVQGDWRAIAPLLWLLLAVAAMVVVLCVLVVAIVFRNRLRIGYTITSEGIRASTTDRRAQAARRSLLILGLLTGRPGAVGAGLIASADSDQQLRWSGGFRAVPDRGSGSIGLRNGWRTLMRVYCHRDDFESVSAAIAAHMARHGTAGRVRPSKLPAYLGRTLGVIVACVPAFLVRDVFGYGLLLPLLVLAFAIAMVWFVRPLAWATLAAVATLVLAGSVGAFSARVSQVTGDRYARYATIPGDDWALTALAVAGCGYVAWLAIATLRERIEPVLSADFVDAGERGAGNPHN